jgi:RHS repeat-associated protein
MNCKPANTSFSPGVHASTSLSIRLGEDFINQQSTAFDTRFKFTAKEKDTEIERSEDSQTPLKDKREREQTGYSYFGARYYDSDVSVWLSVDPLSDKYPSTSGYMYVLGNPIIFVDPNGMNHDWFENEITGDVYYNSDMKKGQEGTGAMTGEGWKHMGENGMFMSNNNDIAHDDKNVLYNSGNTPTISSPRADGSVNMEASIKGDQGKSFMEGQGYNFNPIQQIIYERTKSDKYIMGGGKSIELLTGELATITEKSRYMKEEFKADGKTLMKILYGSQDYPYTEKVGRYQISYSNNRWKNTFMSLMDLSTQMGGQHDMRRTYDFSRWTRYPGSFNLINQFKKENGTK